MDNVLYKLEDNVFNKRLTLRLGIVSDYWPNSNLTQLNHEILFTKFGHKYQHQLFKSMRAWFFFCEFSNVDYIEWTISSIVNNFWNIVKIFSRVPQSPVTQCEMCDLFAECSSLCHWFPTVSLLIVLIHLLKLTLFIFWKSFVLS